MHKGKVLVIDDEADLVELLRQRLTKVGYDVSVAADGEEGLEMARREPPDLILLDIVMPRRNGYEVFRVLKRNPRLKAVPVIVITARSHDDQEILLKEVGPENYIIKPFDMDCLLDRMSKVLVL